MQWNATDLELAIREEGGADGVVHTPAEWRQHPVGARLAAKPVVGIRVLDSTHVIGGPITTRTLAEFGAEVLHLSRIDYPDHMNWRMEADVGKRAAYCDFRGPADHARFALLLQEADVFTCSFLNLDQKGISPRTLATMKRGIIAHELRCYDFEGEWANFRGFDMLVVAVSGRVGVEGAVDAPMTPVQAVFADHLARYVGATAVASALLKRADEGGSYQVRVSLTRMAMWAQEIGPLDQGEAPSG